ncbi:Cu2+-exporting ATPase [Fluviicoccus keumensis]|uniref:Cu2+-exporting ATPase n=1 Tax=Fluviicoccus keumensis TaxID=1435465 RepID=A0A4Q7ZAS8_9GAMM|nr:heavy metal translocating P-type ATPase [Fluviicoccus keumensis]RZU47201.1 Cu2+-exporting ATPase [Fluviicoccus keumensis]
MPVTCYHCGEPLPARPLQVTILGEARPMCCVGCQAVASAIVDSGLENYYLERTEISPTAPLPDKLERLAGYDHPETQAQFVHREDDLACAELTVEGLSCAACAWLIERRLQQEPAVRQASVNLSNHRLRVLWDDVRTPLSTLLADLDRLGYRARPFRQDTHAGQLRRESRLMLKQLGVAALGSMQVMMYAGSLYLGIEEADFRDFFRWTCLVVTIPVFFYSGYPFYRSAWISLRNRSLNMDVPVSIALISTFLISVYATITSTGDIYFDSVSMFIFLLLTGRFLETRARQQAGETANDLSPVMPELAHLQLPGGSEDVPVTQLQPGDRVMIRPGESIPCDGRVIEGQSQVSEALLTGEPLPIDKAPGDTLSGGSQNHDGPLLVEVLRPSSGSTLATLNHLINRALSEKPVLAQKADRIARWFSGLVLVLAAGVYLGWHFIDPHRALWATLAVLVATCPCALSLATPVALTLSTHRLARAGFLITRGHVFETLSAATHVVFDKTGTLTEGKLTLVETVILQSGQDPATVIRIAAALESGSEHPVAVAFRQMVAGDLPEAADRRNHPGQGLSALIDGQQWRIGHARFALLSPETDPIPEGRLRIWLTCNQAPVARFDFEDRVRPEARALIAALRARGVITMLLSGDHSGLPASLGQALGIDIIHGGLSPEDKIREVETIQAKGGIVVMVGDGINDAPVLGKAHISIAMGSGADLAQLHSDVVLLGDRIGSLDSAFRLAQQTRRIIRQNLYWALVYNLAIVPPAAMGYISPLLATIGMSASSLLVVLNALRIKRYAL